MEGKLVEIDRRLFLEKENENPKLVSNTFKGLDGFYLVHGWYIYPDPININKDFEIESVDENSCRIIKEV